MPHDHDLCFSTICNKFIFSNPLYFLYFIFFSPYFFKFIFFISFSPLFLTTSLLLLLSVIATHSKKLGFVQTILDKIHQKFKEGDDEDEFVEFEDFEIYKIVFRDPPEMIMEEDNTVAVAELEKERRLERLFEELDRFEESTTTEEIVMKQDLENVMLTSAVYGDGFEQVKVSSSVSMADNEMKQDLEKVTLMSAVYGEDFEQVKVTSAVSGDDYEQVEVKSSFSNAEIEMKSDLENVGGELQKSETVMMKSLLSGDDQLTGRSSFTEKSKSSRFDSSSSFGSYESTEDSTTVIEMDAQSDHEEFEKLQPVTSSISGENQLHSRRLNDSPVKVVNPVTSSNSVNNLLQVDSSSSFGSYGSMRKEKEWKRTLACKLFEERRSLEGGEEGMDSLWESYETNNSSRKSRSNLANGYKVNKKSELYKVNKKSEFKYFDDDENEEDDDEEDEFMSNGQLCCLKALKLSTGKMNLGMGKPNLVKISKALKGFGWLHRVGSKYGKKK